MSSTSRGLRKSVLSMALGLSLASLASLPALAQNATGAVAGHTAAGAQVTITNPATGFTRTVTADADGNYRLTLLPVGTYSVQSSAGGQAVQVQVVLGSAANVDLAGASGVTTLGTVQVIGMASPVDVTSTESATNITAQEIARIPVARNVSSVALLAPGVADGSAGFGGISFGGSSVAENAFYINGLNVTDFYNRIGFSEAPFDFYQEFQVKTGGYSVEFGRTTGGVVNAVAKSGSNEFHYGGKFVWGPRDWESSGRDSYLDGERYIARGADSTDSKRLNLWASGAIVKDKLFFFAMYEGRDVRPQSTDDEGNPFYDGKSNDGFWGATLDWQVTDNNRLSLMAFSNDNNTDSDVFDYDYDARQRGDQIGQLHSESGGTNWALTWTSYLTDNLSMRLMAGENEYKSFGSSPADPDCNYVTRGGGVVDPGVAVGCNFNSSIYNR